MLDKEQLAALAGVGASPAVSIFLPPRHNTGDSRHGAVRLRNALSAAQAELLAHGMRRPEAEALLQPAQELHEDGAFWREVRDSLAIFAAPELFQVHEVPLDLEEAVLVGPRPHVRPLLPLHAAGDRFRVLTVTAHDARLYAGGPFGLRETKADIARSVASIAAETDYENTRHAAGPARSHQRAAFGMVATYNFGEDPEEQRKAQLIEHLRRLVDAVAGALRGDKTPIVLVAQPEIQGHVRALGGGLPLLGEGVQQDPDSLAEGELHARALEAARPVLEKGRAQAVERFNALAGSGDRRGTADLKEVLSAARFGRVDTLLLAEAAPPVRGRFDAEADRLRLDAEPGPDSVDLLDEAAVGTLSGGGTVLMLPRAEMPTDDGAPLAAILRY